MTGAPKSLFTFLRSIRVRPLCAWYDAWIGVFIDRPKRRVYVFPVPCFGMVIERV